MSKDNEELIAEAREWAGGAWWGDNGLVDRLTDALEAATRKQVATNDIARSLAEATTLTGSDATALAKAAFELSATVRYEALAAVDRVRALHQPMVIGGERVCEHCFGEGYEEYVSWPCYTIATLDGAPEPETAPENYEPKCNCEHVKRHTTPPLPVEGENDVE